MKLNKEETLAVYNALSIIKAYEDIWTRISDDRRDEVDDLLDKIKKYI